MVGFTGTIRKEPTQVSQFYKFLSLSIKNSLLLSPVGFLITFSFRKQNCPILTWIFEKFQFLDEHEREWRSGESPLINYDFVFSPGSLTLSLSRSLVRQLTLWKCVKTERRFSHYHKVHPNYCNEGSLTDIDRFETPRKFSKEAFPFLLIFIYSTHQPKFSCMKKETDVKGLLRIQMELLNAY